MAASSILRILALLLLALLVAGCGGDGDDKDDGDSRTAGDSSEAEDDAPPPADVEAKLEVVLRNMGDKSKGAGVPVPTDIKCDKKSPATCRRTLECPAATPADDPTCAWLASVRDTVFDEPAKDEVCTEIYGGPETATVTGTIDGDEVEATFSRTNGCEIGRWDAAAPLWTREALVGLPGGSDDNRSTTPPPTSAGMCVAEDPDKPVSSDNPPVACEDTVVVEPEIIDDPPEAFE